MVSFLPCKTDTQYSPETSGIFYAVPAVGRTVSRVWILTIQDEGSGAVGDVRFRNDPVLFTADGGVDYLASSMVVNDSGSTPVFHIAFYKYDSFLNVNFWRIKSFSSTGVELDSVDLTAPTPPDPINDIDIGVTLRAYNSISDLLLYSWEFFDFGDSSTTVFPFHIDSDLDSGSVTQWDTERDGYQNGWVAVAPTGQVWSFQPQDGGGPPILSLWSADLSTKEFDTEGELDYVPPESFELACDGLTAMVFWNLGEGSQNNYSVELDGTVTSLGSSGACVGLYENKLYPHDGKGFVRDTGNGGDGVATIWHEHSCPVGIPPLRQQQRDDFYNTPRVRYGPQGGGIPSSIQDSLRNSWGSNTYLMDRETCGC